MDMVLSLLIKWNFKINETNKQMKKKPKQQMITKPKFKEQTI